MAKKITKKTYSHGKTHRKTRKEKIMDSEKEYNEIRKWMGWEKSVGQIKV